MTEAVSRPPFHLAIPVDDLDAARWFYGEVLGCGPGRTAEQWADWDFEGHQLVTHRVDGHRPPIAGRTEVDGDAVPVPHFGVIVAIERFHELASRLRAHDVRFVIEPHVRFEGEPGEQWTMFFLDPAGNALECKAFADLGQLFRT